MALSKNDLNELVQKLSDKDIPLVADFLKRLISHPQDSNIPYDDESLTDDDLRAIEASKTEFQQGKTIRLKDIENDLRN
ncbi:hypothetical protein [Serpentinicella alkaliphila]|uniref:Addiction module component n=1 Tax=Serpentinicella alkaliphila TaxID=1734049 RepID=A0A4R2TKI9_9FIRM|nr:hypothetical protein [Serpentinicella alkaliphila]QUH26622.1 hypothetical protein HZR23_13415 [Serpentinicella alkaliphila]TCQ02912.1 hypothetical protein EDD79_101242 [Serpentinicella alkaliphila]